MTYFDSFAVAYIPKKKKRNLYKTKCHKKYLSNKASDSVTFGYLCIGFNDCMMKGTSLLDYTNIKIIK